MDLDRVFKILKAFILFFFSLFSKKIKTYLEDLAEAISIPAISEGIALILNSEEFYHAHTYCNQ